MVTLLQVGLIDAYCIGPERTRLTLRTNVAQSMREVGNDIGWDPITYYAFNAADISPCIG